ncbi:MAG: tetratricopeptide repeat protein [Bacteroidetes bacterium]|nr:tetratricopeptide repeat protein [Bacteroidota bacterium]
MNRKTPTTTIGLLLLIALVIGACQQATGQATLTIEELQQQAEAGDAEAQYLLGLAYYDGEGVLKNWNQATHWWRKAAEQGHAKAQIALGLAYARGTGVEQDFTEAYAWAIIAQATGGETEEQTEDMRELTNGIQNELTPAQIERGQQRAKELYEQIQAYIAQRDQAN